MARWSRFARLRVRPLEDRCAPAADLLSSFDGISLAQDRANNTVNGVLQYADVNQPNPSGAAGPAHLVSVVNRSIEWVRKDNTAKTSQSLWTFFHVGLTSAGQSGLPATGAGNPTPFDPRVVYDNYAGRFVVTAAQKGADPTNAGSAARLLLAVSKTADPTQGWLFGAISPGVWDGTYAGGGAKQYAWVDYPQVAVDNQAVYLTGDLFKANSDTDRLANGARLWILPKGTLDTNSANATYGQYTAGLYFNGSLSLNAAQTAGYNPFRELGSPDKSLQVKGGTTAVETTVAPALTYGYSQLGGAAPAIYLVATGPSTADIPSASEQVQVIKVAQPLGSPVFTYDLVNVGDVDASAGLNPNTRLPKARQLGDVPNGQSLPADSRLIDAGPHRISQAVWRGDFLSFAQAVQAPAGTPDAGQNAVQWFRFYAPSSPSNPPPSPPVPPVRTATLGTASALSDWTYYPALAEDRYGNLAVGYTGSGPNLAPGAYYAGVAVNNSAYTTLPVRELMAGTNPSAFVRPDGSGRNRWGDQSSMALDPDEVTFWAFNQYATGPDTWATRWGRFSITGQGDIPPTAVPDGYPVPGYMITYSANYGVLANDYVPGGGVLVVANPGTYWDGPGNTGNKLVLRANGGFDYYPGASGSANPAVFTYQATNGTYTVPGTITLRRGPESQVSGVAWQDSNANGVRETGEPLLAGVGALLILQDGSARTVAITSTDSAGRYTLDVPFGWTYSVRFTAPPGMPAPAFTFTPRVSGDTGDPKFNPAANTDAWANGETNIFLVSVGLQVNNINVGLAGTPAWWGWAVNTPHADRPILTRDAAGNVYAAASFVDGVAADLDPGPGTTLVQPYNYVAKYSSAGALLWGKQIFSGPLYQNYQFHDLSAIRHDPATGAVYVVGIYAGTQTFDPSGAAVSMTSQGGTDIYVIKFDAAGVFQWVRTLVNSYFDDNGASAELDPSGNLIVAGHAGFTFTPSGYTEVAVPYSGIYGQPFADAPGGAFVAKVLPNGTFLWVYGYGGGADTDVNGLEVDATGNIYVTTSALLDGRLFDIAPMSSATVYVPYNAADGYTPLVYKLDPFASLLWFRKFTTTIGQPTNPVLLPSGDVAVAVAYSTSLAFDLSPSGTGSYTADGYDSVLLRLSPTTGLVLAHKRYGGTGNETVSGLSADPDGNYYLTGEFTGTARFGTSATTDLTSVGGSDVFVVKVDPSGNLIRARSIGTLNNDFVSSVDATASGQVLIGLSMSAAGSSTLDLDPGPGAFLVPTTYYSGVIYKTSTGMFDPVPYSTITGRAWDDRNGNGVQDQNPDGSPAEPNLENAVVELLMPDGTLLARNITSPTGEYLFYGDYQGRFTVRVRPPAARPNPVAPTYTFSPRGVGGNATRDSDVDSIGQATVLLDFGQTARVDAGLVGNKPAFGWAVPTGDSGGSGSTRAVAVDAWGNVYSVGSFYPIADLDPGPGTATLQTGAGIPGTYLASYTRDGALLWAKLIGAGATVSPINGGLVIDKDGNLVVATHFTGTGDFDPGPGVTTLTAIGGLTSAAILKFTPNGGLIWARMIGLASGRPNTGSGVMLSGLTTDSASNVILSMVPAGTYIDLDPGSGITEGWPTVPGNWPGETDVVVWNTNGVYQNFTYLTGLIAPGSRVAVVDDSSSSFKNDLYLSSRFSGSLTLNGSTVTSAGGDDGLLVKLNVNSLGVVWARAQGSALNDGNQDVAASRLGGAAVSGYRSNASAFDVNATVYNADGTVKFDQRTSGGAAQAYAVKFDPPGNVVVVGTYQGTVDFNPSPTATYPLTATGYTGGPLGPSDLFVWSVTQNTGAFRYGVGFGGLGSDNAFAATVDTGGFVYMAGQYSGTADFDPGAAEYRLSTPGGSTQDGVLLKLRTTAPTTQSALKLVSGSTRPGTGLNSTTTVRVQGQTAANASVSLMRQTGPGQYATTGMTTVSGPDGSYTLDSPTLSSLIPVGQTTAVVTFVARAFSAIVPTDGQGTAPPDQYLDSDPYTFGINTTTPTLNGVDVGVTGSGSTTWTDTVAAGGQRSRLTGMRVRLGQANQFVPANPSDALVITRVSDGAVLPASQYTATPVTDPGTGATYLEVAFTGSAFGWFDGGSLADGRYTVAVRQEAVQAGRPAGLPVGADSFGVLMGDAGTTTPALAVHRLFGDSNGDAATDPADLFQFRRVYTGAVPYNPAFDVNGDGFVDPADLFQFRRRYNAPPLP